MILPDFHRIARKVISRGHPALPAEMVPLRSLHRTALTVVIERPLHGLPGGRPILADDRQPFVCQQSLQPHGVRNRPISGRSGIRQFLISVLGSLIVEVLCKKGEIQAVPERRESASRIRQCLESGPVKR